MTAALAALHDWMEEHPFLTHLFGPLVGALIALVIVPFPWMLLAKGVPALGVPALPEISLKGLLTIAGLAGFLTLAAQWLQINKDSPPANLFPDKRGWVRTGGSVLALSLWSVLGMMIAASLSMSMN
ncbi:hypothetical protein ACFELO_10545 [Oceanicaulis sp. LC35]|uniref:hypothetical protein n=1 Tax=Oceanicaulis sp. LC35 TaxID=3349635 RepID=UPI003F8548BD